jgi:DNA-binding NarL/FixJ family response regulator
MCSARVTLAVDQGQIEDLLGMVAAARAQKFDRDVLAAGLKVLAAWLNEQARLLAEEDAATHGVRTARVATHAPPHSQRLTRRELQIAARIARGMSNRQIAEDLVIATSTTERHVANILSKLGMRSRAHIAAWAVENGL